MAVTHQLSDELDNYLKCESLTCSPESLSTHLSSHKNNLVVFNQNIRSIDCNMKQLEVLISQTQIDFDVLVLTECWLKKLISPPQLSYYNYYFTKMCQSQNEGVVVYIKNNIQCKVYEPHFNDANCIIAELGCNFAIVAIYRPPQHQNIDIFLASLNDILLLLSAFQNVVLTGDINININSNTDHKSNDYLNLLASHGLIPAHTLPTRQNNCLDHIMIKSRLPYKTAVITSAISDHYSVCVVIEKLLKPMRNSSYDSVKIDYKQLVKEIEAFSFSPLYAITDVNHATEFVVDSLSNLLKTCSHKKPVSSRKKIIKPWITPGLLRCMRHRDKLHTKTRNNPENEMVRNVYVRYRNFCNSLLKNVKQAYERTQLQKASGNSKKTWQILKDIANFNTQKTSNLDLISHGNPVECLDEVNHFFANVGKCLADDISQETGGVLQQTNVPEISDNTFVLMDTNESEVESVLIGLRDDCAVGWDKISSKVLKISKHVLVRPITYICNLSLNSGLFPNYFKIAIIHPIHKAGDKKTPNNYRPISVLPTLSKILERLMNNRLTKFLDKYNILSQNQYGFISGRSTEGAVSSLTEYLVRQLDTGSKCLGVFLDLSKAFDTVSIPILISRLERLGIRGHALQLFSNYLSCRKQRVKVGNYVSNDESVTFGVPQGSILGPSLFLIYINQICNLSLSMGQVISYADDTALLFHGKSWNEVTTSAENGLKTVMSYLNTSMLTLNAEKTKFMAFSIRQIDREVLNKLNIRIHKCKDAYANCNCFCLERVSTIKYLGVFLDDRLNWFRHFHELTGRIRKLMVVFRKLRRVADVQLLMTVYYSLCQSIIDYCITAWGGAPKTNMIAIERAQRAVLKVMFFKHKMYPTAQLYNECRVLTVRQLFFVRLILLHHSRTPYDPETLAHKRRKDKICQLVPTKLTFTRRFSNYLAPFLYNKLSKENPLYHLPKFECKQVLTKYLLTLNYDETESILHT